ncbi:MAG: efflux RND transporter permease subunit [Tannerella sp.]|jgi:hydrophobe/amphiphile efflux-1 (HAE1) family protein|nr:efflux RND transporter permease subunit [Tannerella sp.]
MSIYKTAVQKPISTILIFIGVIVLGVFSLNQLATDLYPELEIPMLSVITSYPGASPSDIEQNITRRLEDNLNTVQDLKRIISYSQDNMSVVMLEFEWGINLDEASNDVRDAIGRVESFLPENADKPMIIKFSTSMMPIMYLYATAEESYNGLDKLLEERITNPLNRINGVGAVSVSGAPTREIQVNVDPKKIEAYNLTIEQIGQIITMENSNIPAGAMDIGSERLSLRIEGEFTESDQVKDIVISSVGGKDIKISDIAAVKDTIREMTIEETINGTKGVTIIVQKQSGANSVQIAQEIQRQLPDLIKTLPPDVKINTLFDTSSFITNSISSLTEAVMYALIFVILVVLFFLGRWRATIIIAVAIPISLVTGFIYLMFTGGTINIVSLSSLSIAVGLVVDDAIVVLENIMKHIERGTRPKDAAIYGTNEVWLAVIATTMTLVAVFLPLTMLGGIAGIMFKQLGWIISIVIIVSMLVAITLTPMMTALMIKFQAKHTYKGLGIIFKPIDKFLNNLDNAYAKLLSWTVTHRAFTIIGAFTIFVVSLLLLSQVPSDFLTTSDNGQLNITAELPVGANLEQTKTIAHIVEKAFVEQCPEIKTISVSSGATDEAGFEALFGNTGTNGFSYMIVLHDLSERRKNGQRGVEDVGEVMRQELARHPEIVKSTVTAGGAGAAMMGSSGMEVKVFGYDFEQTANVAKQLAARMRNVKGARDITVSREDMKTELQIDFDREKLAKFGLTTASAATMVSNRINGLTASLYRENGEEYDIIVRYDKPFRESIENIENILLYNGRADMTTGQPNTIRLSEVGKVVERFTPPRIEREDRQRVVTVAAGLAPGAALGQVATDTQKEIDQLQLPTDVNVVIAGSVRDQQDSQRDMMTLLILIVLLVYIVMATQFESFLMPFIVMLSVLFAFTGVFLALWITGTPLGMIAMIGAIMLVGIVVKNGIIIVDFTNLQRERGASLNQAVVTAGKSRLRPVLMTSLTAILGMVPLAFGTGEGSEIWQPMGIVVIGGLSFSTLLTLLVIPAVYSAFNAGKAKKERVDNRVEA